MARKKSNIVYHNMRMNLDNEQHCRIHRILTDLNLNVHKSVNQFLIDATDAYIKKLEGNDLTNEENNKSDNDLYVLKDDLAKLRTEIKDELQKEMIGMLVSCLVNGKTIRLQEVKTVKDVSEQNMSKDDAEADETVMGLVSSWG